MATLHPARCHGLADLGAIAPGYRADLVVLEDLESFRAATVIAGGAVAARDGAALPVRRRPPCPAWVRDTRPDRAARRRRRSTSARRRGGVRVIEIVPGQLITARGGGAAAGAPTAAIVADPARDLAKLAVVERHHATGRIGVGLVRGFGLRRGAFASTVAHDAHNIVVVGRRRREHGAPASSGWRSSAAGSRSPTAGAVRGELALPVAGLLSEAPAEEVVERAGRARRDAAEQGVRIGAPFMTL